MKIITLGILFFIISAFYSCETERIIPPGNAIQVTSKEYIDDLLFVNSNIFQITTSEPATFSSPDPLIRISATGLISRITSGEVVPIDIISVKDPSLKTRIYALGVKDNNYDEPNVSFNGLAATDAYNSYLKGWKTLQKLPAMAGTYSMIMRHADADRGRDYNNLDKGEGPANWWKSCDTTLARQLNTRGRERAVELGKIFKDLQYPITRVFSSEFCRAKETAALINAGPKIITDGRINHPDYNVSGSGLFEGMLDLVKEQPVDHKMTLVEAHHPINERRSEIAGFPDVIPFPWTGGYFVKVEQDHSVTFEGAVSYPMLKYFRDKKLKRL